MAAAAVVVVVVVGELCCYFSEPQKSQEAPTNMEDECELFT